jgi:hypothetical protein
MNKAKTSDSIFRQREMIRLAAKQPPEIGSKDWLIWVQSVVEVFGYYESKITELTLALDMAKSACADILANSVKVVTHEQRTKT